MMTRLGRRSWWVVLGTAAGVLLLSLVAVLRAPDAAPPVAETRGSAALVGRDAPVEAAPGRPVPSDPALSAPEVGRSSAALTSEPARVVQPRRVQVPAAGIDVATRAVGVGDDLQMRLPDDPGVLGWYRFGPAPGSGGGSAVLAGHVDSEEFGVGPLARLSAARPGDTVRVRLDSGRWAGYRVDSVERIDRQALPDALFARSGPERLRLVTCTGAYLPEAGGYQQNLVVTAVPA